MRILGIIVVGFILIMGIVVGFSLFGDNANIPQIADKVPISENIQIGIITDDSLEVADSIITSNDDGYFIDDDGKKHYTINARDSPIIQK